MFAKRKINIVLFFSFSMFMWKCYWTAKKYIPVWSWQIVVSPSTLRGFKQQWRFLAKTVQSEQFSCCLVHLFLWAPFCQKNGIILMKYTRGGSRILVMEGPSWVLTQGGTWAQNLLQDFGQGGAQLSFDPRRDLSPEFAQNCLKTAWFWKKSWGPPGFAHEHIGKLAPGVVLTYCI